MEILLSALLSERCLHESLEQGMRPVRPGFQLRVRLGGDEPRMGWDLDHLHDAAVRGEPAERHAVFFQHFTVIIVYFIAVAVTLADLFLPLEAVC